MPSEFQVVCCYECETFQVHQVKKIPKWQCKVCSAKQSLIKAFKIGNPRECRQLVQQLNLERGLRSERSNESDPQNGCQRTDFENNSIQPERAQKISESEEEEFVEDDERNRSPTQRFVPGLESSGDAEDPDTYQPSSLQNTLQAFYCAMGMNTLDVRETGNPEEAPKNGTFRRQAGPPVERDSPGTGICGKKNKGFSLIKETAKRMKRCVE